MDRPKTILVGKSTWYRPFLKCLHEEDEESFIFKNVPPWCIITWYTCSWQWNTSTIYNTLTWRKM